MEIQERIIQGKTVLGIEIWINAYQGGSGG